MTVHIGAEMLRKAAETIEQRQSVYGPPNKNFKNIAGAWNWWLTARYGELMTVNLDEADVAMMSGLIKDARLAEDITQEDSWVDKAGYAACGRQVTAKRGLEDFTASELKAEIATVEREAAEPMSVWCNKHGEPIPARELRWAKESHGPIEEQTFGPLDHWEHCGVFDVPERVCDCVAPASMRENNP